MGTFIFFTESIKATKITITSVVLGFKIKCYQLTGMKMIKSFLLCQLEHPISINNVANETKAGSFITELTEVY